MLRRLSQILSYDTSTRGNGSATANTTVVEPFELGEFAIDEHRPMKTIVIGAGMSGILAAIR